MLPGSLSRTALQHAFQQFQPQANGFLTRADSLQSDDGPDSRRKRDQPEGGENSHDENFRYSHSKHSDLRSALRLVSKDSRHKANAFVVAGSSGLDYLYSPL